MTGKKQFTCHAQRHFSLSKQPLNRCSFFDPRCAPVDDGVGVDEELPGAGDQRGVVGFAACGETLVEFDQSLVPTEGGRQRRGEQRAAQASASAGDVALTFQYSQSGVCFSTDRKGLRLLDHPPSRMMTDAENARCARHYYCDTPLTFVAP